MLYVKSTMTTGIINSRDYRRGDFMVRYSAGEKKRQLIIDVCKPLFYSKGYKKTTYEDICEAADIPAGSITYHFSGKREIAAVIHAQYEMQNKDYVEKICGDKYDKTTLMVIENYHMWDKTFKDEHIRRFLLDISAEKIPDHSTWDVVAYYYECVMKDQNIEIGNPDFDFIVSAQIGMSDEVLRLVSLYPKDYTFDQPAEFGIRFFMRQIGMEENDIARYTKKGKEIFQTLPFDLRYYQNFQFDDKYVTKIN